MKVRFSFAKTGHLSSTVVNHDFSPFRSSGMVRILAIADEETEVLNSYYRENGFDTVDLIISCGDLSQAYLETVQRNLQKPLLYVKGNHDAQLRNVANAMCIDGKVVNVNGLRICGLNSIDRRGMILTERQMMARVRRLQRKIRRIGGVDVLVTHHPMFGIGNGDDLHHRGYDAFRLLVEEFDPRYLVHGHVHFSYRYGLKREQVYHRTTVVNAYEKTVIEVLGTVQGSIFKD